jgi:hypothetical protein
MNNFFKTVGLAAVLGLPAAGAHAASVTFNSPTGVNTTGNTELFVFDLVAEGLTSVASVTIVDDDDGSTAGPSTPGFDVDGFGFFNTAPSTTSDTTGAPDSTFASFFLAAGPASPDAGQGSSYVAARVNEFDGSGYTTDDYVSLGQGGSLTGFANITVAPGQNQYLVIQEVGAREDLASVTVSAVPLPAAGMLLVSALGGVAVAGRRRRKAA